MEEDLRIQAAPPRTFTNPDKMVEMIRRGNGLRDLASKQAVEHAIMTGRDPFIVVTVSILPIRRCYAVRSRAPLPVTNIVCS